MKKLILITSCVVFFGATAFAQVDTTRRSQPSTPQQTPQSDQLKEDFRGWSRVQATDVPSSLRTTLDENKYKGWESGTVYLNEKGDTYALRTNDRNNPTVYYFDKTGKVTKKPD